MGPISRLGLFLALWSVACGPATPTRARAQIVPEESKRVLVVINEASQDSKEVGEYYAKRRQIPAANVLTVNTSKSENISFDEYKFGIEKPIRERIKNLAGNIDFIVMTRGVPLRLRDDQGYSVDGHIAAMNLGLTPIELLSVDSIKKSLNPYFNATERFSSKKYNMYLVTRLDAYNVEQAKALVDRSIDAKPEKGPFFFDAAENRKEGSYLQMQRALARANQLLQAAGFDSSIDDKPAFIAPSRPLAGYASWGSNDSAFDVDTFRQIRFKPGAIAETFVSTSARTFKRVSDGQSLIADLIEDGVTGVKGYVSEPYTFALAKPDLLFDRYTKGFNLAESFYAASLVLSWKDVVIGDPLCRPYAQAPVVKQ